MIKKIALFIYRNMLLLGDWIILRMPININVNDAGVLLVRVDAIGDFILWTATAQDYRSIYKGRKITLVVSSALTEYAKRLSYWDSVINVDTKKFIKNPIYRWGLIRWFRQENFGVAIQPTYSRDYLLGDSIIRSTNAKDRIGFDGDLSNISSYNKSISNKWYTKLVASTTGQMMELDRNADFLSTLTSGEYTARKLLLTEGNVLSKHLIQLEGKRYFIVFPGASWTGRQWQAAKFAQLIDSITYKHDIIPVLCGGLSEYNLCLQISNIAKANCLNFSGQTLLSELVELIRLADFVVSNETSAVHISAATLTQSVCILGGGHFGRFVPYSGNFEGVSPFAVFHQMPCFGCNWVCTQGYKGVGPVPCIDAISVNDIFIQVERLLTGSQRQ